MKNFWVNKINKSSPFLAVFTLPCQQGNEAIGQCIADIYTVSLTLVGIVAFVQIVYGGFMLLTAAGNTSKTGQAMDKIKNAILGIVLLFSSYLILKTINPDLVNFNFNLPRITIEEELVDPNQLSRITSFNISPRTVSFGDNPELSFTLSVYATAAGLGQVCAGQGEQMTIKVFLKKPPLSGTNPSFGVQTYSRLAGNWQYYGGGKVAPFDFRQKLKESVLADPDIIFPANHNLEFYATFSCGNKELNRSAPIIVNMGP